VNVSWKSSSARALPHLVRNKQIVRDNDVDDDDNADTSNNDDDDDHDDGGGGNDSDNDLRFEDGHT